MISAQPKLATELINPQLFESTDNGETLLLERIVISLN